MRLFVFLLALAWTTPAFAESGREIIDKVIKQPSPKNAQATVKMTLSGDRGGERRLKSFIQRDGDRTNTVIKFEEPADYRGAGILALDKGNGKTDRFIRLNSSPRVRPLPSGSQSGKFLQTDFSYEDMDGQRDADKADHELLREEKLAGQDVWVVASTPHKDAGSAYGKIVQWIRKDALVPVQIEFFKNKGDDKPLKRLVVDEVKKIDGYWISTRSTMSTLAEGTSTKLEILDTDFKTAIPSRVFNKRFLEE